MRIEPVARATGPNRTNGAARRHAHKKSGATTNSSADRDRKTECEDRGYDTAGSPDCSTTNEANSTAASAADDNTACCREGSNVSFPLFCRMEGLVFRRQRRVFDGFRRTGRHLRSIVGVVVSTSRSGIHPVDGSDLQVTCCLQRFCPNRGRGIDELALASDRTFKDITTIDVDSTPGHPGAGKASGHAGNDAGHKTSCASDEHACWQGHSKSRDHCDGTDGGAG
mmetsp:Transcript_87445/g.183014  ORF Transcript_87445/g.183014 Transcript_87445/m.183014 type:complete len:225 (-) Transcript_87445:812-1486(-)